MTIRKLKEVEWRLKYYYSEYHIIISTIEGVGLFNGSSWSPSITDLLDYDVIKYSYEPSTYTFRIIVDT